MIRWHEMEICETLPELVDPRHTALLLWDFAKGVVGNSFNAATLIPNAARLLQAARRRGIVILFSQQNNMRIMGDAGAPTVRMRMKQWGIKNVDDYRPASPGTRGSPGWEIVEEVTSSAGEIRLEKFIPDAFLGTCLEWWLRKHSIETIILTGVNVATGINATALHATNLGYYAAIARDCVGGRKEDYETAMPLLERLFDVAASREIIDAWET
jgi:nicotinamidase-related amidase